MKKLKTNSSLGILFRFKSRNRDAFLSRNGFKEHYCSRLAHILLIKAQVLPGTNALTGVSKDRIQYAEVCDSDLKIMGKDKVLLKKKFNL